MVGPPTYPAPIQQILSSKSLILLYSVVVMGCDMVKKCGGGASAEVMHHVRLVSCVVWCVVSGQPRSRILLWTVEIFCRRFFVKRRQKSPLVLPSSLTPTPQPDNHTSTMMACGIRRCHISIFSAAIRRPVISYYSTESVIIRDDHDSGVSTLTMNKPEYNVLSWDMLDALQVELNNIAKDEVNILSFVCPFYHCSYLLAT